MLVAQLTIPTGSGGQLSMGMQGRFTPSGVSHPPAGIALDPFDDWNIPSVTWTVAPDMTPGVANVSATMTQVGTTAVAGYTTYQLSVTLDGAENVYAIYGTAESPLSLPPAYQSGENDGPVSADDWISAG